MASVRAPLFDISFIRKIFDTYSATLTSQLRAKKTLTSLIFWFREDVEKTKKAILDEFIIKIDKALKLDNSIPKFLEVITELDTQCEKGKKWEKFNLSKYRIALRGAKIHILKHIQSHSEFQNYIQTLKEELKPVVQKLEKAEMRGYDPTTNLELIKTSHQLLLKLANLGDIESIQAATKENLFSSKDSVLPGEAFRPLTHFDEELSASLYVIYNIPWMMQPNLDEIFFYRVNQHSFPSNMDELKVNFIHAKENKESKSLPSAPLATAVPPSTLSSSTIPEEPESKSPKNLSSSAAILENLPMPATRVEVSSDVSNELTQSSVANSESVLSISASSLMSSAKKSSAKKNKKGAVPHPPNHPAPRQ